jgi:hypothetical protein
VAQAVKHLLCNFEVLSSNPNPTPEKKIDMVASACSPSLLGGRREKNSKATWGAVFASTYTQDQPGKHGDSVSAVKHLLSMCKALYLIPSTTKKKNQSV